MYINNKIFIYLRHAEFISASYQLRNLDRSCPDGTSFTKTSFWKEQSNKFRMTRLDKPFNFGSSGIKWRKSKQRRDLKELIFLLVFIVLSTAFAVAALVASFICSPKAGNDAKNETYECGMKLFSDARIQFDIKFFNYAILFLIFAVETIFLFPFAVTFNQLQFFALAEVFIFVALLLFALIFAIKKNILRWQ